MKISSIITFRGISFSPIKLNMNQFDGYSITLFKLEWVTQARICLISNSWSLFHFGLHARNENSLILCVVFIGFRRIFYIKPRIIKICQNCKSKISDTDPLDGELYCDECNKWIPSDEIETVKRYNDEK